MPPCGPHHALWLWVVVVVVVVVVWGIGFRKRRQNVFRMHAVRRRAWMLAHLELQLLQKLGGAGASAQLGGAVDQGGLGLADVDDGADGGEVRVRAVDGHDGLVAVCVCFVR